MDVSSLIFNHIFWGTGCPSLVSMNGGNLVKPVLTLPRLRNVSILMNDSTRIQAHIWAVTPPELCAAGLKDNTNLVWVRHESCSM